jgi:hypothetical protein
MPHEFEAQDGDVRSSGFPAITRANGTSIPVSGYAFDAAAIETLFFRFRASDYVSGNVTIDLDWYADTASTGAVMWGAQLAAITPNTDTQDIETDGLPAVTTVTTTHLGTVGQRLHRSSITLSGAALDSLAADDQAVLCVTRQASNAADTMAGDAILTYLSITA